MFESCFTSFLFSMSSSERVPIEVAVQYVTADNDSDYSNSSDEEFTFSSSSENVETDETEIEEESDVKEAETEEKEVPQSGKRCGNRGGKRSIIATRGRKSNRTARYSKKNEGAAKGNFSGNTWLKLNIRPNVPEFTGNLPLDLDALDVYLNVL